jgi:hypothetical protein
MRKLASKKRQVHKEHRTLDPEFLRKLYGSEVVRITAACRGCHKQWDVTIATGANYIDEDGSILSGDLCCSPCFNETVEEKIKE